MTPGGKASPNAKNEYSLISAMAETGAGKKRRLQAEGLQGQFSYKFKEGHSKNFKQELKFKYLLV